MFTRDKNLKSLERFIYKKLGLREGSCYLFANIVGVLIDIKPTTQGDWPLEEADAKTMWLLKQKLEALKLYSLFGDKQSDFQFFYVAKSRKRATELRDTFQELSCRGASAEINTKIGRLLGYPESAIQYYIRLHPENGISDNHRAAIERNRYYAHSLAHEDEEFAAYEEPLYHYLEKHCPRTANFLRKNKKKRWLN